MPTTSTSSRRPDVDQSLAQIVGGVGLGDRDGLRGVDRAGVERDVDVHDADPGLGVAREECPLHRRGTAPTRQQAEMDVDHRDRVEHVRLDQPPEGDDDAQVGVRRDHVVDDVAHREPELDRQRLDRARRRAAAAAAALVGLRDDEDDVVAGRVERPQGRHGHLRRAEVDESLRHHSPVCVPVSRGATAGGARERSPGR